MKRWLVEWAAVLALGLLLLGWFVRYTLASRFDLIPGNIGDARFLLYLFEHWYQVLTGRADWLSPGIFYPETGVLGFSDSVFLFGASHSLFRAIGFDAYTAYQIIAVTLPLVGYLGAWLMLRRWLGFGPFASFLGAALFGYSSALYTSMAHAQLEAASLLPFLAMLLGHYLSQLGSNDQWVNVSGLAFCIFFPLLAYTSFYTAWFLVLWTALAATVAIVWLLTAGQRRSIAIWLAKVAKCWPSIAANAGVGAIFCLPFTLTYMPVLRLFSRRPFAEIASMLPSPVDMINVGFENYAWGWLLQRLAPVLQARPTFWELDKGLSPLVLVGFVYGSLLSLRRLRDRRDRASIAVLICVATVWSAWLLMLKVDGYSLWWVVYRFFPAGGAVRAVYRFNISLMLPVAIVVAFAFDHWLAIFKHRGSRVGIVGLAAVALAMIVEQGNAHRDVFSKSAERLFMASVPPVPDYCRAMVMLADKDTHMGWWAPLQIDAMLIAQANHIPTLNGYSGWNPDGWALHFPTESGYHQAVRDWAAQHKVLSGLCSFHYETRSWAPFSK